jgi:hypothetical protein
MEESIPSGSSSDESYSHILQKTGVLRNFSVTKVIAKKDIDALKQLIREVAKDEDEYKTLLASELAMVYNVNDKKNPVPGIIHPNHKTQIMQAILAQAKDISVRFKKSNLSEKGYCFLIGAIVKELGLTQETFNNIDEDDDPEDFIQKTGPASK